MSPTPEYPARYSAGWFRLVLGLIVLAPVRLVAFVAAFVWFGAVAQLLATMSTRPLGEVQQQRIRRVIATGALLTLRCIGLRRLRVEGRRDLRAQIIVSNHMSWIDSFFFGSLGYAQLADQATLCWPFTRFSDWLDYVVFDRSDKLGRCTAATAIAQRSKDRTKPPLVIFPEGTVSNGRSLLRFKTGAFAPQAPVQPVVLKYTSPDCDMSWTFGCKGYLWRLLAQPYFDMHVTFMAVHLSDRTDPTTYAKAVRTRMAVQLEVPGSNVDAKFAMLMATAEQLGLPLEAGTRCYDDPWISTKQHRSLLRAFAAVNTSKSGEITRDEVAAAIAVADPFLPVDEVVAAMGGTETFDPPAFVAGARSLLQGDAAFRCAGLALLDPTGAVVAAYGRGPKQE